MGKLSNSASRVFFDEFDLSGDLTGLTLNMTPELGVVTPLNATGPRRVMGNYDHDASFLGFLEPTDEGYDEKIFDALTDTSDHFLSQLFGANAEGSVAYDQVVRVNGQPRSGDIGGAVALNFDAAGSNGVVRGLVLGNVTSTGAEDRTGRNQGATSLNTIYAVIFRLLAFTGTDVTLKIQESSDDGSGDAYGDVSGLTSGALAAIGSVRATTSAATEAWKRLNISGTFSSATILVTGGTVAGT